MDIYDSRCTVVAIFFLLPNLTLLKIAIVLRNNDVAMRGLPQQFNSLDALELGSPRHAQSGEVVTFSPSVISPAPSSSLRATRSKQLPLDALRSPGMPSTGSPLAGARAERGIRSGASGGGSGITPAPLSQLASPLPAVRGAASVASTWIDDGDRSDADGGGLTLLRPTSTQSYESNPPPSTHRERGWNNRFGTKATLTSQSAAGIKGAGWRQGSGGGRSPYAQSPSPYSPLYSAGGGALGSPMAGSSLAGATRDERRIRALVEQREAYVDILAAMLASATTARHSWPLPHEAQALGRCLNMLRRTSVLVVERIVQWQREKSYGRPFLWEGEPYLQTMKQDLEFMAQLPVLARASDAVPDLRKLWTQNMAYVPEGATARRIKQLDPMLAEAPLPGVSKERLKRARRLVLELGGGGGGAAGAGYEGGSVSSKRGGGGDDDGVFELGDGNGNGNSGGGPSSSPSMGAHAACARPVVRAAELMVGIDTGELELLGEMSAPPVALLILLGGIGLVLDVGGGKSLASSSSSSKKSAKDEAASAVESSIDERALSMGWDELRDRLLCDIPRLLVRMQRLHELSAVCAAALRTHLDHVSLRPERLSALEGSLDEGQDAPQLADVARKLMGWLQLLLRASVGGGNASFETKSGGGGAPSSGEGGGASEDVIELRQEIALLREHLQLFVSSSSPAVAARITEASKAMDAANAATALAAAKRKRAVAAAAEMAETTRVEAVAATLPEFRAAPMQLLLTEMRWLDRVAPAVVSVWLDDTSLLIEMRELRPAESKAWSVGGAADTQDAERRDEEAERARAVVDARYANADIDDSASSEDEDPTDPYQLGGCVGGVKGAAPWRPLGAGAPVWSSSKARWKGDRAIAPPLRVLEPHSLSILGLTPTSLASLHFDDRQAYLARLLRLLQWQYWKRDVVALAPALSAVQGGGGSALQASVSLRINAPLALVARGRRIAVLHTPIDGAMRDTLSPSAVARSGPPSAHIFAFVRVEAMGVSGRGLRITVMPAATATCPVPGATTSINAAEVDAMLLCYDPDLIKERSGSWAGFVAIANWMIERLRWNIVDVAVASDAGGVSTVFSRGETLSLIRDVSDALPLSHVPGHPTMPLRADVPAGLGALRLHCNVPLGSSGELVENGNGLSVAITAIEIQALCWGIVDSPIYPTDPPPADATDLLLRLLGRLSLAGPRLAMNRSMILCTCALSEAPRTSSMAQAPTKHRITIVAETVAPPIMEDALLASASEMFDAKRTTPECIVRFSGWRTDEGRPAASGDCEFFAEVSLARLRSLACGSSRRERQLFTPTALPALAYFVAQKRFRLGSADAEDWGFGNGGITSAANVDRIPSRGLVFSPHDVATIAVKVILRERTRSGEEKGTNVGTVELGPPGTATLADLRNSIGSLRDAARLKLTESADAADTDPTRPTGWTIYAKGAVVERAAEARSWLVDVGSFVEIRRGAPIIPLDEDEASRRNGERATRRERLHAKRRARAKRRRGKIPRYLRPKGWKPKKRLTKAQRRLRATQCAEFVLKDVVQMAWESYRFRQKIRERREKRAAAAKAKRIPHCVAQIEKGSMELTITRDLRQWGIEPGSMLIVGDRVVCVRVDMAADKKASEDKEDANQGKGLSKGAAAAVAAAEAVTKAENDDPPPSSAGGGAAGSEGEGSRTASRPGSRASTKDRPSSRGSKGGGSSSSRPGTKESARPGSKGSRRSRPGTADTADTSHSGSPGDSGGSSRGGAARKREAAAAAAALAAKQLINIDDLPAIEEGIVRLEMPWLDDTESSVELPVWVLPVVATTSLEENRAYMLKKARKWAPAPLRGTRGVNKPPVHRGITVPWGRLEKLLSMGKKRGHQSPLDYMSRVNTQFILSALYDNMTHLEDNGGWNLSARKRRDREALDGSILLKFVRGIGLLRPTPGQAESFVYQKAEIKQLKKHAGATMAMACGLGIDKISLDIMFARCRNSGQHALTERQYRKVMLPDLAALSFPFLRPEYQMAHIIVNHIYKWGPVETIIWTEATRLAAVAEAWNYCAAVRMQVWVRVAAARRVLRERRYQRALEIACCIRSQSALRMIFERRKLASRLVVARREKERLKMMAARRRAAKKAGLLFCEVMTADHVKYVISINRLSARNVRLRIYKADTSFVQDFHLTEVQLREICELEDEAPKSQLFATQAILMFCAKLRMRMRGETKMFILVRHASQNHGERLCRRSCRIGDIRDDPLVATGLRSDAGYLLVVTIYSQYGDYFFHIYEPDTSNVSGSLTLSSNLLGDWLRQDNMTDLLTRGRREELCVWLMDRLRCQHNKKGQRTFLLEIERRAQVISQKASKLQAAFRSKRTRNMLKKTALRMWRREWDMMAHGYFYANISTVRCAFRGGEEAAFRRVRPHTHSPLCSLSLSLSRSRSLSLSTLRRPLFLPTLTQNAGRVALEEACRSWFR